MTLAVTPSGTEGKRKQRVIDAVVFLWACAVSGGLAGWLCATLVYAVAAWWPFAVKVCVLGGVAVVFALREWGFLPLRVPQRHWQIPVAWVGRGSWTDMVVWGAILGAGVFTYVPFVTFYVAYLYVGFFATPSAGVWAGIVYGVSRALPTVALAVTARASGVGESEILVKQRKWHKLSRTVNALALTALPCVLLWLLLFSE